jgi:peptide/nickel transport system substrate-binding protein
MFSRPIDLHRVLTVTLFLAGSIGLAIDLPAQDAPKEPPSGKRQRSEEEDADAKSAPAKPSRDEKVDPAQPKAKDGAKKRTEEEEDTGRSPKKVITVGDEDAPAKPLPARLSAAGFDLGVAAKQAKNPHVAKLYRSLAIPYDRFIFASHEEHVVPIAAYVADNPQAYWKRGGVEIQQLDADGKPGRKHNPSAQTLQSVRHYEQLAMDAVDEFLIERAKDASNEALSREEQLTAAEMVLAAAVRFHDSAMSTGARKGSEWNDAVYVPLKNRLLDIQLEQLKALADAGQWQPAFNLAVVLVREHRGIAEHQRIAKPLIDLLNASFNKGINSGEGTRQAFRRLRELENQFPDRSVFRPISEGLRKHADKLFALAKDYVDKKDPDKALEAIAQAVELAPDRVELRLFQRSLMQKHRILRVGVRNLPVHLSPVLATTDSELRAVELLFESLVKYSVDAAGNARYVPGLAEGRPQVEALTRNFLLPYNARWSNGQELTAFDIRATVDWAKLEKGNGIPAYWASLLHEVIVGGNPYRVKLSMAQGYFEPLSLMSFKVMPADMPVDSEAFALNPVGSGPYRFDDKVSDEGGRKCVSFIFNSLYGLRHGKEGLPRIREVRFFAYKPYDSKDDNATDEFERLATSAPLDMMLDLTPAHAAAIAKRAGAASVYVPRPADSHWPNRRIYFLAVNHRIPILSERDVRRALAHAINREQLLDDFFRQKVDKKTEPILGRMHAALNGPYPAGSWACDPKVGIPRIPGSLDLFDPEAKSQYTAAIAGKVVRSFQLKYPADDPSVKGAMEALCKQLSSLVGFQAEPVGVDSRQLRKDVEAGTYELAYYYYDYPDETYWLSPLLAPRPNGLNIFGSQPTDELASLFQNVQVHRDFTQIKEITRRIHEIVYKDMPFIPLWQLDPLIAIHNSIKVPPFDPLVVFNEIDTWSADSR